MSQTGHLLRRKGEFDQAEAYYRQTITMWQERGHQPAVCHQLECFAFVAVGQGEYVHAARLIGAARAARERLNSPLTHPRELDEMAAAMGELAGQLGETERDAAIKAGETLDLDSAVDLALAEEIAR